MLTIRSTIRENRHCRNMSPKLHDPLHPLAVFSLAHDQALFYPVLVHDGSWSKVMIVAGCRRFTFQRSMPNASS